MSTSIHLIASIVAFITLVAGFSILAIFVRSKRAFIVYRLTTDLIWINVRTQFLLLSNPIQNETAIFWGLTLLYAMIFYIARPGGMGMMLRGQKAKFGNYTTILAPKLALSLWLLGIFSILIFGQGEFIGKQLSNPQLIDQIWIDNQYNIGYDHYQLGSINIVYLYNQEIQQYDTIKADINLDNQVDITLHRTNQGIYDRYIQTYTPKTRLIFYIIAPLCILALLGMRKKPEPGKNDTEIQANRSHMRQFVYNTMQIVGGVMVLLPLVGVTMTLTDITRMRDTYSLCIQEQQITACSTMAQDLQLERGQLMNENITETLHTYVNLLQGCLAKTCPSNQITMIEESFDQWIKVQQKTAKDFAETNKTLLAKIAGDSFLYTLDSIPMMASDIFTILNQNTNINTLIKTFQIKQTLNDTEKKQLENIILDTDHTRLYYSLVRLTKKSVYIGDEKLRSANFASSNLQATQLLHLRHISPSVRQHHAFIGLNTETDLNLQDITIHLLTADIIGYLTEKNPLYPLRFALGKGAKLLGLTNITYMLGFTQDAPSIYMEQAIEILSRAPDILIEQRTLATSKIINARTSNELTLRGKTKAFTTGIYQWTQWSARLIVHTSLSSIKQANWVKQTAQAHTDLLFDLGM